MQTIIDERRVLKVLIADDSTLVRERLGALISEMETMELVGQSGNALQAIEAVRRLKPDVVILDIRMPGGGIHALETIKASTPAPVVIMLTAFPYPQYRTKCLEAGAEYFYDKTTEFEQVAGVLQQLLQEIPTIPPPAETTVLPPHVPDMV